MLGLGHKTFPPKALSLSSILVRIRFRLCVQVYKCQHSLAPGYLAHVSSISSLASYTFRE